ncbi:metallophosphoesterase [Pseudonocardia alaniniphila]|uniref:Metallophosphoesterase n=1 Tax=Pseudonocardia alaniniphila TaxID=75291 RepID=A0ABS9T8F4_9PSEU|nr:metallophosphoesterase [Pseudonocardia alaniniphila]MCH6164799.1 metallophosphoesterase [Pseudonocardia alaniniphila]
MTPEHTLIQLTDLHLVAEPGELRHGVDTADALARALTSVEESGVRPAALLFTGDLADAGEPGAYERLREIVEPVARRLGAPALYAMGNHDDRAALRRHLLGVRLCGEPGDTAPLDHVTWVGGLRIVVLDSTVPGHVHGELSPAQLAWLEAELAEPAPAGTVLALHHPPLPTSSRLSADIQLQNRSTFAAILAGTDVRVVLAGHTHVVSAGAVAGIPVWIGGATSYISDALVPAGGERTLNAPSVSRIDLFADAVVTAAVPVGAEHGTALSAVQVTQRIAEFGVA